METPNNKITLTIDSNSTENIFRKEINFFSNKDVFNVVQAISSEVKFSIIEGLAGVIKNNILFDMIDSITNEKNHYDTLDYILNEIGKDVEYGKDGIESHTINLNDEYTLSIKLED